MNSLMIIDSVEMNAIETTLNKIAAFQAIIKNTLRPQQDFDVIPGTNKPSLLKAGAEKINMLMGVTPIYDFLSIKEDYDKEFFAYNIRCTLTKNGEPVAQGVGSCNSKEGKYRWKNVKEADLPSHLDKSTLKSKTDKWNRTLYQIENDDSCSLANTILKMAKKRAFVDATLQLAALSDVFTQDLEDMRDYLKNEQNQNMTLEEAAGLKVNIGKHKGKTLGEIYKTDSSWIKWFQENGKDETIKKAIQILSDAAKTASENKKASKTEKSNEEDDLGGYPRQMFESDSKKTDFEKSLEDEDPFAGTPFAMNE